MRAAVAVGVLVAGLAAAPAEGAQLDLMGGPRHAAVLCGERGVALFRTAGRRISVGRGTGALRVERCEAGRWVRFARVRLLRRGRAALPSGVAGDFRVRGSRARAYYRVLAPRTPVPPSPPPAAAEPGGVVNVPVTFEVVNQNRSRAACRTDDAEYEIRGRLVAPRSALSEPGGRAVTLYMHGIGWTHGYWHFTAVPGYDHATELAREGHASLVYDQIGYGESGRPDPAVVCYGGEADVASQIVDQLRKGSYGGPEFAKVALASHSVMGLASQPEAYSFKDVDALIVTSWADQGFSDRFRSISREIEAYCATTGGYYEASPEMFEGAYFVTAEPEVRAAATGGLRAPIPCGEPQSAFQTIGADVAFLQELRMPVLLVYGSEDALFGQPAAGENQAQLFAGNPDVTLEFVEGSGHALALERTAPVHRAIISRWLSARGL